MTRSPAMPALLLLLSLPAAAVPLTLSQQGYVVDVSGAGLDGVHTVTISLYDDAQATNPALWSEVQSVSFTDGHYSTMLGDSTALDASLLDQAPLFVGVSVAGGVELTPRPELASVPYSVLSETAFEARGGTVNATAISADTLTVDTVTVDGTGVHVDGETVFDGSGAFQGDPMPLPELGCADGQLLAWNDASAAWTCGTETDAVFASSAASDITAPDIANWTEAFSWGDHEAVGYLEGTHPAGDITTTDLANWDAALGFAGFGLRLSTDRRGYTSCDELHQAQPELPDGVYSLLDPGTGGLVRKHCLMEAGHGWEVVYYDTFDEDASGWSPGAVASSHDCSTVFPGGNMLGAADDELFDYEDATTKTYSLSGIDHTEVLVTIDFVVLDTWQHGYNSAWIKLDDQDVGATRTFSWDRATTNHCSHAWNDLGPRKMWGKLAHDTDTLEVEVASYIPPSDFPQEFWGLDNVVVAVR